MVGSLSNFMHYAVARVTSNFACGSKVLASFLCTDFGALRQNQCTIIEEYRSAEGKKG
jgi:hypothetical protein